MEELEAFVNERLIFLRAATSRKRFVKVLGIAHMSVDLKEGILCLYCWEDLEHFEFLRCGFGCGQAPPCSKLAATLEYVGRMWALQGCEIGFWQYFLADPSCIPSFKHIDHPIRHQVNKSYLPLP